MRIIFITIALFIAGCASQKANQSSSNTSSGPKPFLSKIVFYDKTPEQRFIMRFEPKIPQYELWNNEKNKTTEIKWKTDSKGNFEKIYYFKKELNGIDNIHITVDGDKGYGIAKISHAGLNTYVLTAESKTDLLIKQNLNPNKTAPVQQFAKVTMPPTPPSAIGKKDFLSSPQMRLVASDEPADKNVKLVSIKVTGAPLDKVLRALATDAGRNIIMSSKVSAEVSAAIVDMPYEKALELILRSTPYRAEHMGNTTIIRSELSDKNMKAYKFKYLDVNAVLPQIQAIASKDAAIVVDANTNTIVINDRFQAHRNIEELIAVLDKPSRQVEVEAAILEVDLHDILDYGIDIGQNNFTNAALTGINTTPPTFTMGPNGQLQGAVQTNQLSPLGSTSQGVFVGLTWNSISGIISAIQSKTRTHTLARPSVVSLTDQDASMLLGSKLGYKTQVITNGVVSETINFLTVGTQLKLRPHITANNDILMTIAPEVSSGSVDASSGVPTENTTTTTTKVMAHNGQTIVIGGLLNDVVQKTSNRVPVLGELPILGALFGGTGNDDQKNEIMILLSPKVIFDTDSFDEARYAAAYRRWKAGGAQNIIPSRTLPASEPVVQPPVMGK